MDNHISSLVGDGYKVASDWIKILTQYIHLEIHNYQQDQVLQFLDAKKYHERDKLIQSFNQTDYFHFHYTDHPT